MTISQIIAVAITAINAGFALRKPGTHHYIGWLGLTFFQLWVYLE